VIYAGHSTIKEYGLRAVDEGRNRSNVLVQWYHTDCKLLTTMWSINKSEERGQLHRTNRTEPQESPWPKLRGTKLRVDVSDSDEEQ